MRSCAWDWCSCECGYKSGFIPRTRGNVILKFFLVTADTRSRFLEQKVWFQTGFIVSDVCIFVVVFQVQCCDELVWERPQGVSVWRHLRRLRLHNSWCHIQQGKSYYFLLIRFLSFVLFFKFLCIFIFILEFLFQILILICTFKLKKNTCR